MTDATFVPESVARPAPDVTHVAPLTRARSRTLEWDLAGFAIALLVGVTAAWQNRFLFGPDATSYLDYSDRFLDGTWRGMPNGYWSPGYAVLLAVVRAIIGTDAAHDAIAVRAVYLLGYTAAAAGTFWLSRTLQLERPDVVRDTPESDTRRWAISVSILVWALLIWSVGAVTGDDQSTPDTWVTAATVMGSAAAVYVQRRKGAGPAILLGLVLGAGYLLKAVMFPIGLMILGTLGITQLLGTRAIRSLKPTAIAGVVFALVCAPQVITQSRLAGHFEVARVGTLVHEWYVGDLPCPLFTEPLRTGAWDECMVPRSRGEAIAPQPFPRLTTHPSVYYFPEPAIATFPVWYDATRWYPRVHSTLHLKAQIITTVKYLASDWALLLPFITVVAAVVVALRGRLTRWRDAELILIIPSIGTFVIYALVYSSARYLGAAVMLLVLGIAPLAVASPGAARPTRLAPALAVPAVLLLLAYLAPLANSAWYNRRRSNGMLATTAALNQAGLQPGMRVGIIGDGYNAFWARLARVHVIAEVHSIEKEQYWLGSPATQAAVIDAFRRAGVSAVVADPAPPPSRALPPGWTLVERVTGDRTSPGTVKPLAIYRL